jgi:cellulose synthase/poly-beta-1,6-N-acetylglucosamine synthase-like glycosyltransferase
MLKVWIRQSHRWLSMAFTMAVIANFIAMALAEPPAWNVYAPLTPLFLLMLTDLYMFVLSYSTRRRETAPD